MQHLGPWPVEHREADVGTVLGRIDMHPKRTLPERTVDNIDYGVGNRGHVGLGGTMASNASCTWCPKPA